MERWVRKNEKCYLKLSVSSKARPAFTLIELLVVISIISLLLAIVAPALTVARKKALVIQGIVNQRSTATSLNLFAQDNNDRYPPSIATLGSGEADKVDWQWADPRLIAGYPHYYEPRQSNGGYRSMSAYLSSYIENPEILHCKNAPDRFTYFQQVWDAADEWDHPDTPQVGDPMMGSYCFYWNYNGYLTGRGKVFKGPRSISGGKGQSSLLLGDYFGADTWRNPDEYGSCEPFEGSGVTSPSDYFANFWTGGDIEEGVPDIKLNAVFTDGHAESYTSRDVVTMEVSKRPDGSVPVLPDCGKGKFFIPANGMP